MVVMISVARYFESLSIIYRNKKAVLSQGNRAMPQLIFSGNLQYLWNGAR